MMKLIQLRKTTEMLGVTMLGNKKQIFISRVNTIDDVSKRT